MISGVHANGDFALARAEGRGERDVAVSKSACHRSVPTIECGKLPLAISNPSAMVVVRVDLWQWCTVRPFAPCSSVKRISEQISASPKPISLLRTSTEQDPPPPWERIECDNWCWLSRRTRRTLATGILSWSRQTPSGCWPTMKAIKKQEQ